MAKDSRYPYTYAADYIRSLAGYNKDGTKLSRGDASHIRQQISIILNMDDNALACKLADYYKMHEDSITEESVKQFTTILNGN